MDLQKPERLLIRAGFLLFVLALLTGFAVPAFLNQRMALAAHITGILNALILMALAACGTSARFETVIGQHRGNADERC